MEMAEQYFTKDYIQHNPNVATGRDAMVAYMKKTRPVKPIEPKITFPVISIIAEGDLVMIATVSKEDDPEKPGSKYLGTHFDLFRIENGKIAEHWTACRRAPKALQLQPEHPARSERGGGGARACELGQKILPALALGAMAWGWQAWYAAPTRRRRRADAAPAARAVERAGEPRRPDGAGDRGLACARRSRCQAGSGSRHRAWSSACSPTTTRLAAPASSGSRRGDSADCCPRHRGPRVAGLARGDSISLRASTNPTTGAAWCTGRTTTRRRHAGGGSSTTGAQRRCRCQCGLPSQFAG